MYCSLNAFPTWAAEEGFLTSVETKKVPLLTFGTQSAWQGPLISVAGCGNGYRHNILVVSERWHCRHLHNLLINEVGNITRFLRVSEQQSASRTPTAVLGLLTTPRRPEESKRFDLSVLKL